MAREKFSTIKAYIAASDKNAKPILRKVREAIAKAVPKSEETISYGIPAFKTDRVFIYFAAFKTHIGIYPPIRDDERLLEELKPYRNTKGNVKFPLDEKIPYKLIGRMAKALFKQNQLIEKHKKTKQHA